MIRFLQCIYYVAFENFEIQLATQKNLVIFMCAFFCFYVDLAFFLKNEDEFLTKQKFNIKCTVKKGQMFGNALPT